MISVLFIGNSYTYYNDMFKILMNIAETNGEEVFSDQIAYPGFELIEYLEEEIKYDEIKGKLNSRKWDYVVLQDQSRKTLDNLQELRGAVEELSVLIRDNGAKPLLYSTWSYRDGSENLEETELSYDDFYKVIIDGYSSVGKEFGIDVVDIGYVFKELHKDVNLLEEDDSHPNVLGSYIIAYKFYEHILGKVSTKYKPKDVDEQDYNRVNNYLDS